MVLSSNCSTQILPRFGREPVAGEKILYGRSRGRNRTSFDEAVRKAEEELRAEADRLEVRHPTPSVGQLSNQIAANQSNKNSRVSDNVENYEDDFDQESEIVTEIH